MTTYTTKHKALLSIKHLTALSLNSNGSYQLAKSQQLYWLGSTDINQKILTMYRGSGDSLHWMLAQTLPLLVILQETKFVKSTIT
jgi:hypothetical protein